MKRKRFSPKEKTKWNLILAVLMRRNSLLFYNDQIAQFQSSEYFELFMLYQLFLAENTREWNEISSFCKIEFKYYQTENQDSNYEKPHLLEMFGVTLLINVLQVQGLLYTPVPLNFY